MSHYSLVERRIRYVVAISLVLLIAFAVRLVDVQAVRAAGYANRADMELAKKSIKNFKSYFSTKIALLTKIFQWLEISQISKFRYEMQ